MLDQTLAFLQTEPLAGLPPLTGGMVGYLGYDIVRRLEKIDGDTPDELHIPELAMLLATDIAALDHHEGTVTLIANALNWDNSPDRVELAYEDAVARLDAMTAALGSVAPLPVVVFERTTGEVTRRTTSAEYQRCVEAAKEHIRAGDAFQIVLSQRFDMDTTAGPLDIYRTLRATNPSPYMYLLQLPAAEDGPHAGVPTAIVGSSPEALVTVRDGHVTMHPIAGTRPRGVTDEEDVLLAKDLLADEKERSEHVMLVDLGRNDLGRVCRPGTVKVVDFFTIERYSHVMHIVSTVTGMLDDGRTAFDALTACFPAGTLSGAPKPRAMQIIDDLEPARRGVYGGIVGYLDFHGDADTAITIRTALVRGRPRARSGRCRRGRRLGTRQRGRRVPEQGRCGHQRRRRRRHDAPGRGTGGRAMRTGKGYVKVRTPMRFGSVLVAIAGGAALTAGSAAITWASGTGNDELRGPLDITATGGEVAPALVPVAAAASPRWGRCSRPRECCVVASAGSRCCSASWSAGWAFAASCTNRPRCSSVRRHRCVWPTSGFVRSGRWSQRSVGSPSSWPDSRFSPAGSAPAGSAPVTNAPAARRQRLRPATMRRWRCGRTSTTTGTRPSIRPPRPRVTGWTAPPRAVRRVSNRRREDG